MARRTWGLGKRRQARLGDTDYEKVIGEYGSSISPSGPPSDSEPFGVAGSADEDDAPNPYLPPASVKGRGRRKTARSRASAKEASAVRAPFEAAPIEQTPSQVRAGTRHEAKRRASAAQGEIDRAADEAAAQAAARDESVRITDRTAVGAPVGAGASGAAGAGARAGWRALRPSQVLGVLAVALLTPTIVVFANTSDRISDPWPTTNVPGNLTAPQVLWSFDHPDRSPSRKGLAGSSEIFESVYQAEGVVIARFDDRSSDVVVPSQVVGLDQLEGEVRWSFDLDDARCAKPIDTSAADVESGMSLICSGTRAGETVLETRNVATGDLVDERVLDFPRVEGINVTSSGVQVLGPLDSETGAMELAWFDRQGVPVWRIDLATLVPPDLYAYDDADEFSLKSLRWFALDAERSVLKVGDVNLHLDGMRAVSLGSCRQPVTSQGLFLCPSDRGFEARDASGELVWTNPMAGMFIDKSWGEAASVAPDYEVPRGNVTAIDWATGEFGGVAVEFPDSQTVYRMGSPEMGIVTAGPDVAGLSPDGRTALWFTTLPVEYLNAANLVGDVVVADAGNQGVYVLDSATGDELGRYSIQDSVVSVQDEAIITLGPYEGIARISFP